MIQLINGKPLMDEDNESFRPFRDFLVLAVATYPKLKGIVKDFDERDIYFLTPLYPPMKAICALRYPPPGKRSCELLNIFYPTLGLLNKAFVMAESGNSRN